MSATGLVLHSPTLAVALALIIFLAAIVQVLLGMGFGLMAAPLLALIDPALVPAPVMIVGMLTAAWAAWAEREHVAWEEVGRGVVGRIAGVALAIFVLARIVDTRTFMLVFGLLTGFAVLLSVSGWRMRFNARNLYAATFLSGFMGTITSVGAPPLAILYAGRPAQRSRATLSAFFAIGAVMSLSALFGFGLAGTSELVLAGFMVVPMLAGVAVATRLKSGFDRRYRLLLLAVAAAASLLLIWRGLA